MPWLRKNERMSVLSRASRVRSLRTPVRLRLVLSAAISWLATPDWRTCGSTSIAKTQPHGGEPNSQSRTSPIRKPTTRPSISATRNQRCSPRAPMP